MLSTFDAIAESMDRPLHDILTTDILKTLTNLGAEWVAKPAREREDGDFCAYLDSVAQAFLVRAGDLASAADIKTLHEVLVESLDWGQAFLPTWDLLIRVSKLWAPCGDGLREVRSFLSEAFTSKGLSQVARRLDPCYELYGQVGLQLRRLQTPSRYLYHLWAGSVAPDTSEDPASEAQAISHNVREQVSL